MYFLILQPYCQALFGLFSLLSVQGFVFDFFN